MVLFFLLLLSLIGFEIDLVISNVLERQYIKSRRNVLEGKCLLAAL